MSSTDTLPSPPESCTTEAAKYNFPSSKNIPPTESIFESIIESSELPREKSQSLPPGAYVNPAFLDFETSEIFHKEWISLAHISQLPNPGDFVKVDVCGEPMLVTRGKDNQIKVLSRVCRHRGMDLMPNGYNYPDKGNERVILCPYHLWSYEMGGKLVGVPEMQEADGFDRTEVCLHEYRSEIWEGFIFATLSKEIAPLSEKYSGLRDQFIGKWNLAEAELVWDQHWDCEFNWKILLENFMEAYHHLGAHRKTLEPFLPAKGCWTEPYNENYSVMHLPLKENMKEEILASGDAGTTMKPFPGLAVEDYTEWWVYLGFPNFLIFNAPDRTYWYRLLPTGPETCSLTTTMLINPATKEEEGYDETYESEVAAAIAFHLEDMEVCDATQQGVRSTASKPGRLSHLEEPIWHFQKYLADRIKQYKAT
ncbi:MAG: aromatic ring-hydroxylating dioxygenase subunit alpha [Verrucomicrobiales bacterium]|nr:aromatic ring-hydroxylating dioxygenase subunit alpha [Verrucomicrobiales bacterium]